MMNDRKMFIFESFDKKMNEKQKFLFEISDCFVEEKKIKTLFLIKTYRLLSEKDFFCAKLKTKIDINQEEFKVQNNQK